jgi:predicted ArsR family transcriptional regulator
LLRADANAVTLSEHLRINISAIRGHLDVLELTGLVSSSYEHATRGRPKRLYSLTPQARNLFPQQTVPIFSALLQVLVKSSDTKTFNSLIRQVVTSLWQQILPSKPIGSLQDRLDSVVDALDNFGFYASLEIIADQFAIVVRNDVFRSALANLPSELTARFQQEFWNRLRRFVGEIRLKLIELPDPSQHGFRVLVEERRK